MSVDGLWTVEFEVPGSGHKVNAGVVLLQAGRIYGGDSGYYYLGSYVVTGDAVSGDVQATHYHGPATTAFGDTTTAFSVQLSGKQNPDGNEIVGTVTRPRLGRVNLRMIKRVPLA
jgi:hypothetical protein